MSISLPQFHVSQNPIKKPGLVASLVATTAAAFTQLPVHAQQITNHPTGQSNQWERIVKGVTELTPTGTFFCVGTTPTGGDLYIKQTINNVHGFSNSVREFREFQENCYKQLEHTNGLFKQREQSTTTIPTNLPPVSQPSIAECTFGLRWSHPSTKVDVYKTLVPYTEANKTVNVQIAQDDCNNKNGILRYRPATGTENTLQQPYTPPALKTIHVPLGADIRHYIQGF